ncbi:hypothetical protein G7072_09500 [Nocardioides sp. HDW12B]|uniref:putative cytokinetic ring protein SteA n=1 Tax=Nocardioides sp. HDW12B TaxID=2714939 RepID=UPI001407EBFA|nr:putative cytokinetic ring protein SteA [Nocardioides sp. HDW12B]QIK66554.1 hypothetical protein G7072_09500 [Nocardioides sp. HDW12B]
MKLPSRQVLAPRRAGLDGPRGPARVDRRLTVALRRARPGDVLVVDHLDLDRAGAEAVLGHGVAAVVNVSAFISGRYPSLGAEVLARAGVALVEEVGPEVLSAVRDGTVVGLEDGHVLVDGEPVAVGTRLDLADVLTAMELARGGLTTQLASFTHNTTELLRREEDLLLHGRGFPETVTRMRRRPVVVVVRDFEHERDLRGLRRFIREQRPVLVGVDAGGDALLARGLVPDLLVVGEAGLGADADPGHHRRVSDEALTRAREVLLHADPANRVIGTERLDGLGVRARRMSAGGTTEDVALLVADHEGASLIVTVGTRATLEELLDQQRTGMSSSFLTRLRVGPRVVDAATVPALYTGRVRLWQIWLVLLVGLLALAAAVAATPVGQAWGEELLRAVQDLGAQVGTRLGSAGP